MEFFRHVPASLSEQTLKAALSIETLSAYCDSIDRVLAADGNRGEIYCLWGQFIVHREEIRGGVRFSLPGCPNALAWTATEAPSAIHPPGVTLHCTINRQTHDADFLESIEMFMDDWQAGIARIAP
jgi:hypothetical protein